MNLSGNFIKKVVDFYKINIDDILVICDDIYTNTGEIRVRKEGGDGGHNGLKSIDLQLGTNKYKRMRVGVGPKLTNIDLPQFVLQKFNSTELALINSVIQTKAINIINDFISDVPFAKILSKYNK